MGKEMKFLFRFMNIQFLAIFILGLITSCNIADKGEIGQIIDPAEASIFEYNLSELEMQLNTTNVSLKPSNLFDRYAFSITPSLPRGLFFNPNAGTIIGSPEELLEETEFTVIARNNEQTLVAKITLSVSEEPIKDITYNYNSLNFVKSAYSSYLLGYVGSIPTSASISPALDAGLNFNTLTGEISGTPTSSFSRVYRVTASNSQGEASTDILVVVSDELPTNLSYSKDGQTINTGEALTPMVASLSTTPDNTEFTIAPPLPSGLTIDSTNGTISGTPSESSTVTTYTVTVSNETGEDSTTISLTVNGAMGMSANNDNNLVTYRSVQNFVVDINNDQIDDYLKSKYDCSESIELNLPLCFNQLKLLISRHQRTHEQFELAELENSSYLIIKGTILFTITPADLNLDQKIDQFIFITYDLKKQEIIKQLVLDSDVYKVLNLYSISDNKMVLEYKDYFDIPKRTILNI